MACTSINLTNHEYICTKSGGSTTYYQRGCYIDTHVFSSVDTTLRRHLYESTNADKFSHLPNKYLRGTG